MEFETNLPLRARFNCLCHLLLREEAHTHKYGIKVLKTYSEAIALDKKNGNSFWHDAILKEIGNKAPPGWRLEEVQQGYCLWRKNRLYQEGQVNDGHKTSALQASSSAGVVLHGSIRIVLTYALNELDITTADICNAYLQAPSSEKHYIDCGAEFGLDNVGKVALILWALYGGKAAGRDFWLHLRNCMEFLWLASCVADPDGESILRDEIGKYFILKEELIGPLSQYPDGKLCQVTMANGQRCWAFGSTQYVQDAVNNDKQYLANKGKKLQARAPMPLAIGY
ncbi:hypothetical protein ACHAWF_007845 [Thalassiosira exigua]